MGRDPKGLLGSYDREKLLDNPKDTFMNALKAEGVQCDVERYPLLHLTPFYRNRQQAYDSFVGSRLSAAAPVEPYRPGDLPVSEDFHARLIALPVFTKPQKPLLDQYIEAFRKAIHHIEALK